MSDSPRNETDAKLTSWLKSRVAGAGWWPRAAVFAGLAATGAAVVQAYALAAFFQRGIFDHAVWASLIPWLGLFGAALLTRVLAGWAKEECGIRASRRVRQSLRADLVDRVGALGPAWKTGQPSGALASLLLEQVDGLDGYVARYLPQQSLSALSPLVVLAAVFPLNWICGALLLGTAPLIPLFMILVGLGARAVQTRQLNALARLSGQFLDTLRGLATLQLLHAESRRGAALGQASERFRARTMEVLRLAFLSSTMLEFFSVLAIALTALYLGFTLLGQLDFGIVLTFQTALFVLLLAPDFYQPLRDLGTHYHARAEALASAERIKALWDAPVPSPGGTAAPPAGAPSIELRGVDFAYVPGVPVVSGVTFQLAPEETVAVTGPSGSGKSTLLRLIQGQVSPRAGSVLAGGVPLADLDLERWRARIGWMSQHPRLLADTLAGNLRVARCDAVDAELADALEFAGLGEWFAALPAGLDTRLGEGGRGLSGGQLRRLALARLRLRDASVLLLDEPTASLDDRTEELVLAGLAELKRGKTTVLVTHHPRPLLLADRVISLPGGQE